MVTNDNIFQKLILRISQQRDIETDDTKISEINTEEQAKHALTQIIIYLIDTHFEKLLWILYRIDVDEVQLKKVLKENSPIDAPGIIAEMVLEREKQKRINKFEHNKSGMQELEDLQY